MARATRSYKGETAGSCSHDGTEFIAMQHKKAKVFSMKVEAKA
jgi:hypothetical protein